MLRSLKEHFKKYKFKGAWKIKVHQAHGFFPLLCWVSFTAGYKEMLLKRGFKYSLAYLFQKSHETALYFMV